MPRNTTKTSPAESQAKTNVQTVAPEPVTTRKAAPVIPQTIDLITDAVSEMLTTGTSDRALNRLLLATIEHKTRRVYERGIGIEDEKEISEAVDRYIKRDFEPWKQDIFAVWRHNRRESPAAVEPSTITERIRLNARDVLESRLESFVGGATPEDIRFMSEVMVDWDNRHLSQGDELYLGMAFEYQLDTPPGCYMRIPERLVSQVQKYIDALRAIEDKAVV